MNAIEQAREWRNEASCGHAAKVAVALLDELEQARNAALEEAAAVADKVYKKWGGAWEIADAIRALASTPAGVVSQAAPQVTDEQIVDLADDYLFVTCGDYAVCPESSIAFARALLALSAPPAAETPHEWSVLRKGFFDVFDADGSIYATVFNSLEALSYKENGWRVEEQKPAPEEAKPVAADLIQVADQQLSAAYQAGMDGDEFDMLAAKRKIAAASPQEQAPADKDAIRKRDRRIEQLECFVKAYGPKSLQYDIEHPNDGLNAPDALQSQPQQVTK